MSPGNANAQSARPAAIASDVSASGRLTGAVVFYSLTREKIFARVSPSAMALLGIPAEKLVGQPFSDVPLEKLDLARLEAEREKLPEGETEIAISCHLRLPGGFRACVIREAAAADDSAGIDGLLVDVSRPQSSGTTAGAFDRLFQTMLDYAPVGLSYLDSRGVALDCNERFAAMLGARRRDYLGFDVLHGVKNEHVREGVRKAINGEVGAYEGEYSSVLSGHTSYFRVLFTPVTPGRSPSEAIVMFEDISETRRAQAELEESEKRHRIVFENAPLAMVHYANDGTIINCNDAFVELMGSSRERLIGFNTPKSTSSEQLRQAVLGALAGERASFEGEFISTTGGKKTNLRVVVNPIAPGVSPTEAIATFEEISERVRQERLIAEYGSRLEDRVRERTAELTDAMDRLRDQEDKLRQIVEHSGDLFFFRSPQGMLTYVSPRCREYLDCSPSEALRPWKDFVPDSAQNREAWVMSEKALATGERQPTYEISLRTVRGRVIRAEVRESPVVRNGRVTAIVGAITDVTERKRAEDALKRSLEELALAQQIAHFGSWTYYPDSRTFHLSKEMARIHGLDAEYASATELEPLVHPEDRAIVREALSSLSQGKEYSGVEYRILTRDGQERILYSMAQVASRDASGKPSEIAGTAQDITERRQAEDQFELARRVFDSAVEGVVVTGDDGKILFVNKGFTAITGYLPEEVLGQNPRMLKSDRHGPEFYEQMWTSLREKGSWEGEIWNRRKNGEAYPEWLSINAMNDARGRPYRYVSVFHDISELWKRDQALRHQASHDGLTGLPNRDLFMDRLDVAITHAKREDQKIVVAMLDLDNFQTVNDALGHPAGDRMLQELARRLSPPASWEGALARPGGDEFLFFLERAGDNDAPKVTNWLISALEKPFFIEGRDIFITASLGLSIYPTDGDAAEDLVKNADLALHQSKQLGRNTYSLYQPELNDRISRRLEMVNDLRQALERKEIVIHYQPQADAVTGRIVSMEALVRWKREGRLISPAEFIPLAEETGLIVPIGEFVLREACRTLGRLRKDGHTALRVSVNLSARQFREENLAVVVASALMRAELPPHLLELEITESALAQDAGSAMAIAKDLTRMGVILALDDFGTGYSSLSYLRSFPIKCLKIDKSFVDDIPADPEANALVNAVIAIARSLNLSVVAEGVETDEQLWYLREQKCELIQGYRVSRPLPDGDIDAFLRDNPHYPIFKN